MSPLSLSKATLSISYELIENGNSKKQRKDFTVGRVERLTADPDLATLQSAILGIQRIPLANGQDGHKVFRKTQEVMFAFDSNPNIGKSNGQVKITYHLVDDASGQVFKPSVTHLIEIDQVYSTSNELQPVPLLMFLTHEAPGAVSEHKLIIVKPGGGPGAPVCSGCFDDPSPQKRKECAHNRCYSSP